MTAIAAGRLADDVTIEREMPSRPGFANRHQLALWADTVEARTEFPRVVRRLILETTPRLVSLGMPAGEGVSGIGWDGSAKALEATAWVPAGRSLWEISVEKNVGTKADKDYGNRTTTPDGSPTNEATYIEVVLRVWRDRHKWAAGKSKDGRWAEVRAKGLDDVELWIEAAPVTWAWFSEHELGLHPHGHRSTEAWWESWRRLTNPALSAEVILAGRTEQALRLRSFFEGDARVTTISAPSIDEAKAFIAAVLAQADNEGSSAHLSRSVFVDDQSTWRELLASKGALVLVALEDDFVKEVPPACSHHVLVPMSHSGHADIVLPDLDASGASEALKSAGVEERRADGLGRLARRSLIALRRKLALNPSLHSPPWSSTPVHRRLRAAILAESWSDAQDGDQQVLTDLAGETYEVLREHLVHLSREADPLGARVSGSWHLVSPADAWGQLAGHLTPEDLARLEAAVDLVVGEKDPALELETDDRWRAPLLGKQRAYSPDLRRGLSRTLAFLGVGGRNVSGPGGTTGDRWAEHLVRKLLGPANGDATGDRWASLSDLLPLLAEAAPDAFIECVRAGIAEDPSPIAALFPKADATQVVFGGRSGHTGLLWAMERLAWSADHFGAAAALLGDLHDFDFPDNRADRPLRSLASIFCPWNPQTSATSDARLAALDSLRARHNGCAWQLMASTLPGPAGVSLYTSEPEVRDWKKASRQ